MIDTLIEKIKNIIKLGSKTKTIDNQTCEATFLGKPQPVLIIMPYGMNYNAPNGSLAYIFQQEAKEEALHALLTDPDNYDSLGEKEVSFGIPDLTPRLKFKNNGTINIKILDADSTDFMVRYNELETAFNQLKQDFDDFVANKHNAQVVPHTHLYTPGTGTPTQTSPAGTITNGNSSTADITPAKVEKINVPGLGEE